MAKINNKKYDALIKNLEKILEGIEKNQDNSRLVNILEKQLYIDIKNEIELAKQLHTEAENKTRLAYEKFEKLFENANKRYANDKRIIKGVFGIRSPQLYDFGIIPNKINSGRKRKEEKED